MLVDQDLVAIAIHDDEACRPGLGLIGLPAYRSWLYAPLPDGLAANKGVNKGVGGN